MVWFKLTLRKVFFGVSALTLFEEVSFFQRGFFLRGASISKVAGGSSYSGELKVILTDVYGSSLQKTWKFMRQFIFLGVEGLGVRIYDGDSSL